MKERLTEIQLMINGFYLYDDDIAHQYTALILEAVEIIRNINAIPTSILDNAKNDAVYELSNELANRMNESFFHANPERRKSEFKISRMLVTVAIGNVLSDMSA